MKINVCVGLVVGVLSMCCADSAFASSQSLEEPIPSKNICIEITDESKGRCTKNLRYLFSNYVVKRGKVYWIEKTEFKQKPCLFGIGAIFHNLASWRCLTADRRGGQIDHVEQRTLRKVVKFSSEFRTLEGYGELKSEWQQRQLANYAKDRSGVYFENRKLYETDPQNFSIIFPFGEDPRGENFYISQNGKSLFFYGIENPYVDLNGFKALKPIHCPRHGLTCTPARNIGRLFERDSAYGVLGWIGQDVILLHPFYGATVFRGMASPDMFYFLSSSKMYFFASDKFYEVNEARDKLIPMDVQYYERFNY